MEEYLEKIIKGRRSISEFSDREISNEIIDELIDLASFAPSSTNTQPWFFLIFKSEENKKRLNDFIALGYEKLKTQLKDNNIISWTIFSKVVDSFAKYWCFDKAPVYILCFARSYDKKGLSQIIKLSNNNKIEDIANESTKTSVAMAMQNLLLGAYSKWLWTRIKDWIKFFLIDDDIKKQFYNDFSIPNDYSLISWIQMGYQNEKSLKRVSHTRLPLKKIRKYL